MKKCFPIILIMTLLILILQVVANYFITERSSEYVLTIDDEQYMIVENLTVDDDVQYYDFKVSANSDETFTFTYVGDLNKQKEIIKDIKHYKVGDLSCIYPVYKRNKTGNVSCLYNGEQVSYSYLKQINNSNIDVVIKSLKGEGFESSKWEGKSTKLTTLDYDSRKIEVYQENILDNYTFLIWRYRGLYILKSDKSVVKDYLENDQYDNKYSALVGNYYVSADPKSDNFRLSELIYYNTKGMGKGKMYFDDATSNDYYFNGVFEDRLYLTDVGLEKQYKIDPLYETIEVVGDKSSGFVNVKNGKLVNVSASDFLAHEVYFSDSVTNKELESKYSNIVDMKKLRKFYYFRTSDGSVYRVHENNIDNAELLFKFDNLTEWVVKNDDILVVAGDMVYFYTEENGLVPIAKNSELNYNHKNICDFWEA